MKPHKLQKPWENGKSQTVTWQYTSFLCQNIYAAVLTSIFTYFLIDVLTPRRSRVSLCWLNDITMWIQRCNPARAEIPVVNHTYLQPEDKSRTELNPCESLCKYTHGFFPSQLHVFILSGYIIQVNGAYICSKDYKIVCICWLCLLLWEKPDSVKLSVVT